MAAEARERMTGTSWRRPLLPLAGALFMPMSEHNIQWEVGVDGQRGDALGCERVVCEAQLNRLLASLTPVPRTAGRTGSFVSRAIGIEARTRQDVDASDPPGNHGAFGRMPWLVRASLSTGASLLA